MDLVNDSPRVLGNRYELGDLLGRGGMAEVHLGRDTRLGRTVAIKLLRTDLARDATFQARFRREAQSAAALNHPAIVAVYDTGEESVTESGGGLVSLPYIVMEYVEGRTLREILTEGTTLDVDLALEVTSGVLTALEYSHRIGIVHRDIKPANVMLTPTGDVKVMDFGIARAVADASSTMTQTQAVIGTAQYLSPEQARGEQVDIRSDLYSTGCLLFELLTGRPPFVADSPVAIAYQHVREQPPAPSSLVDGIPESVDRIVLHSLAKDRDARYQSAAEFRADVDAARGGRHVSAPVPVGAEATTQYIPPADGNATRAMAPAGGALLAGAPPGTGPVPTSPYDDRYAPQQQPDRRRQIIIGAAIVGLLAIIGLAMWTMFNNDDGGGGETPANVTVPRVIDLPVAEAVSRLQTAGLQVERETRTVEDKDKDGIVLDQNPQPDASVPRNSSVTVTVGQLPDSVEVPDLQGLTQDQAVAKLRAAGLGLAGVTTENSTTVGPGRVIRSDPEAGETIERDGLVRIILANSRVQVPDVVGKDEQTARDELIKSDLQVVTRREISDQPEGTVLRQDPQAGTQVARKTRVTIVVAAPAPTPTETPTPTFDPGDGEGEPTPTAPVTGTP